MDIEKLQDSEVSETGLDNKGFTIFKEDATAPVNEDPNSVPPTSSVTEKANEPLEIDRRFGYGLCKPRILQVFNRPWALAIWFFIFCWLEGFAINGLVPASIPSLERQFQLSSSKSSLIPAFQDFGALFVVLFVSFIGGRYNKPTVIALGSLIMALGSFVFTIPHIVQRYHWEGSETSGPSSPCQPDSSPGGLTCDSEDENYVGIFVSSQILHGIGFTPMFTLGIVYMDDNTEKNTGAVYVGLCYAAAAIGVASGFFVGGEILQNYFVEFDRIDQNTLGFDARDTRWVGAWWVGLAITAVAFVVISLPIFGYPKYMPGNTKAEQEESALKKERGIPFGRLVKQGAVAFIRAFLRLIKNPTYIFITLGGCTESMIIFGVSAFSFKFLVEMYSLAFDQAGNYLGGLILVGSLGMFLGGAIIRIFNLELLGMIRINVIVTMFAAILGFAFLARCPEVDLAGLRVAYPGESTLHGYIADCNSGCSCRSVGFNPVCGEDNIVYYSACHAGCTVPPKDPMGSYCNCSCVAVSSNASVTTDSLNATATQGRCPDGCTNINILLPCLFIMMILVLTVTTPQSMAVLRCVDEDLRPFALALGWVLFRLLGSIPGPVFLGAVIDRACELWQSGSCGGDGVCMLYIKADLALNVMLWWVIMTALTSMFFLIALIFAMRRSQKTFEIATIESDKTTIENTSNKPL